MEIIIVVIGFIVLTCFWANPPKKTRKSKETLSEACPIEGIGEFWINPPDVPLDVK
jgi:hypothetical protein